MAEYCKQCEPHPDNPGLFDGEVCEGCLKSYNNLKNKKMNKKKAVWIALIPILAAIGILSNKSKSKSPATAQTQVQIDSAKNQKAFEKGKFEAEVNLRTLVRSKLNDPKSFDVIEQKSWVVGETIIVMIEYTAKNGFGGVIRSTAKAEADKNGNIQKVF